MLEKNHDIDTENYMISGHYVDKTYTKFIIILGVVSTILIILLIYFGYSLTELRDAQRKDKTTVIGELKQPCNLKIIFKSDSELIDVVVHSPNGRKYTKDTRECTIDKSTNTIEFNIITSDLGEWKAVYKEYTNKKIEASFEPAPIDKLFVFDPTIEVEDKTIKISFIGLYGEPDVKRDMNYSISLSSDYSKHSLSIATGDCVTNERIYVETDISKAFELDNDYPDWNLSIAIYDRKDLQNKDFNTSFKSHKCKLSEFTIKEPESIDETTIDES